MAIIVKYFASLRENIGRDGDSVEAAGIGSVGDLRAALARRGDVDGDALEHALCAVNYEYADDGQALKDGDEVAFFPPVTGG